MSNLFELYLIQTQTLESNQNNKKKSQCSSRVKMVIPPFPLASVWWWGLCVVIVSTGCWELPTKPTSRWYKSTSGGPSKHCLQSRVSKVTSDTDTDMNYHKNTILSENTIQRGERTSFRDIFAELFPPKI